MQGEFMITEGVTYVFSLAGYACQSLTSQASSDQWINWISVKDEQQALHPLTVQQQLEF